MTLDKSYHIYIEDYKLFSINTEFIFIEWYENKSGDSYEWNMLIFIPRDENISRIYRKKLEFSVYYILSVILNNSVVIKNW